MLFARCASVNWVGVRTHSRAMRRFTNEVVTGGTSGIGLAAAKCIRAIRPMSALCQKRTLARLFDHRVGRRPAMVKQRDFRGDIPVSGETIAGNPPVKNVEMSGPAVLNGSYGADLPSGATPDQRCSYLGCIRLREYGSAPAEARAARNDVEECEHEHRSTR